MTYISIRALIHDNELFATRHKNSFVGFPRAQKRNMAQFVAQF